MKELYIKICGKLSIDCKHIYPSKIVPLGDAIKKEVIRLLKCNQKINAIKYYRAETGMVLAESKNYVDGIQDEIERIY
jgi:hypothetical protein